MNYYFLSCDGSVCYATPQADWLNAFIQAPTVGNVYLLENITDLPDGCYQCVSSCERPISFSGYQISSSRTIAESGCSDDICSVSPATTICAERCDTPGVVYQITGYSGSSIVDQSFYLDISDFSGCYVIVSDCGEAPTPLDITNQTTVDYDNCDACNPLASPSPTPTVTSTSSVTPTVSPSLTTTPTPTPLSSQTPTPTVTSTSSLTTTPTPTPSSSKIVDIADKLESCETSTQNQKVFIFYDGTSLDANSASGASESIRSWYQSKVDNSELLPGNLYEGVIGKPGDNGENWLWWASYPYLGSLTGSSLVSEFSSPVSNSLYDSDYCQTGGGGLCIPNPTEFNDSIIQNDIYRRINRGRVLSGPYSLSDSRSNGVPFDHQTGLSDTGNSGPGTFSGQETNYIVIFVTDEANGVVGLYHGGQTKTQLYTNPFELLSNGWFGGGMEPSDRFEYDYQAYLKVWQEIKSSGGTINGLIYPVINNSTARIPFVQHSVATIEGETISGNDFLSKYGDQIDNVGPESLNLSALTYTNVYSGLTGTTTYQNLPTQYQNGAGLKNFGFYVDPTVENFTEQQVSSALNDFLLDIEIPANTIYITPGGRSVNQVYNIDGDCYTVAELNVTTSEPIITPTSQLGPYVDCDSCESTGCFSGTTDGEYFYTDCCGVEHDGTSIGTVVCVDTSYSYGGLAITNTPCVQNCDQGPLDYTFAVTGVCENLGQGVIEISPIGGIKPYTLQNTSPGGLLTQTGNGPFYWNNLSAGTYVFRLNDSSGGENQDLFINVIVDGCFCANIDNVSGTTCGDDTTGEFNVNGSSNSLPYNIELYRNGVLNQTVTSTSQTYGFSNLPTGIYYAFVTDFGGATAQTESVVIEESVELDFGLSIVNESPCNPGNGSALVTGATGVPPFTYLWSNNQTGISATGLTQGTWGVTVTDSQGCSKTTNFNIGYGESLGVVSVVPIQSTCFNCDGQMQVVVSGGTPPYTYVGDTGQQLTTQSNTFLLTNLCAGGHSVIVTDAGSCQTTAISDITSTSGFRVVSVNVTNSDCGQSGSIQINIDAPQGIFTYTLTDDTGSSQSITTSDQTYTFGNLDSGTYDIEIQFNNDCVYTTQKTVANEDKFTVISSITGATCGENNGQIQVFVSEGSQTLKYPFDYILTNVNLQQVVYQQIDVNDVEPIISNLASGAYLLTVTDNENCTVSKTLNISQTNGVDFSLSKTDCVLGGDGTATVTIYNGEPPFTYTWSSNLPSGESGGSVSNLSDGTYTVTVTDSNGCNGTKSVTINCNNNRVTCYELNSICEQDFITTSGNKRGFEEMLNEAFFDLTSGHTNCELVESIFYANIGITGTTGVILDTSQSFYTGTTLSDYPEDSDWINIINTILSTVTEIESFSLDTNTNQLTIISNCDGDEDPLRGAQFSLGAKVELEIECDSVSS